MIRNPATHGSQFAEASESFDSVYSQLLRDIEVGAVESGNLDGAIGTMYDLGAELTELLLRESPVPGFNYGPTFHYYPA